MKICTLLVFGSRHWTDEGVIKAEILRESRAARAKDCQLLVIHGGCRGADMIADKAARNLGVHVARVDALWDELSNSAGPIRNSVMVAMEPDFAIGFHDDIERSSGSKDCRKKLQDAGLPCVVVGHQNGK